MLRDSAYLLDILQAAEFAVLGPMAAKHPVLPIEGSRDGKC